MADTKPCPACGEALSFKDPAFGRCFGCGGLWLTPEALAQRGGKLGADLVATSSERPRICANCAMPMACYRSPLVEIDACDDCGGIFLDRGELTILLRARQAPAQDRRFTCEICERELPLSDRLVGAIRAVCKLCGERLGNSPEEARRKSRELADRAAAVRDNDAAIDDAGSAVANTAVDGFQSVGLVADVVDFLFTILG